MGKYLRRFQTTSQYNAYTADTANFIKPNVSLITETNTVEYNPIMPPETRVVAKFNVTSTSSPTKIVNKTDGFSVIEIDGVTQQSVVSEYTFETTGEHTVKYTLINQTTIGRYAFSSCSGLTSIAIPDSVTSIDNSAFSSCSSLTSIAIPDSVTSIDNGAFRNCTSLTSIVIPSGVTSIGISVFSGCTSLTSIVSNATTAPTIQSYTFESVNTGGTLTVPSGSNGYDTWMQNANYYLGKYGWTKVEQ